MEKAKATFIEIKSRIVEELKRVYDPEIPVDIYELGLIYEINVDMSNNVEIIMTLTSPACPVAGSLPGEVEDAAKQVEDVNSVKVELVFDPAWSMDHMSEIAKLELGFM